jgi:hypothetical protein
MVAFSVLARESHWDAHLPHILALLDYEPFKGIVVVKHLGINSSLACTV